MQSNLDGTEQGRCTKGESPAEEVVPWQGPLIEGVPDIPPDCEEDLLPELSLYGEPEDLDRPAAPLLGSEAPESRLHLGEDRRGVGTPEEEVVVYRDLGPRHNPYDRPRTEHARITKSEDLLGIEGFSRLGGVAATGMIIPLRLN